MLLISKDKKILKERMKLLVFKIYKRNLLQYIYLVVVLFLFLIMPQISLNNWFNSKMDKLEGICLREFDGTPMQYYFNSDHKSSSVKVKWDVMETEGISELYKMKAQYGWAVVKRDYETKYINTGYGEIIKKGMDSYLKDYPNIKIDEKTIEYEIEEILKEEELGYFNIGMDYSVRVLSGKDYARIFISTFRTSDEDHRMVDYIYYSFE
jgi:hypothetical protein